MTHSLGKTGLQVSQVGFGCYRIDLGNPEHFLSLQKALRSGCNLIDTSANYGDGESEELVGKVLSSLFSAGELKREKVVVVTKAGYVQGKNLEIARERERSGQPFPEMVKYGEGIWHCISPAFLEDQITRSLERMKLSRIDVLLLHNPEYFLKAGGEHLEYYRRIQAAFEHLEKECERGRLSFYGISSNTFPDPKEAPDYTSLETVLAKAREIVKNPRFAVIQLPLNLFEPGAALEQNNSGQTVLELARDSGLGVLVNRPLNAFHENQMIRLADFPHRHGQSTQAIQDIQDTEGALQQALSRAMELESRYPSRTAVSFREIAWGHILRENFERVAELEGWRQILSHQIRPTLDAAKSRLSKDPQGIAWIEEYLPVADALFSAMSDFLEESAARISRKLSLELEHNAPELEKSPTLSRKAIRIYRSLPGVSSVLVGMRKPSYVEDALAMDPLLKPDRALELLANVKL